MKDGRPSVRTDKLGVVIPCYRVSDQVLDVIAKIGPEVERIIVVDDGCPEGSGRLVESSCRDPRVRVMYHAQNLGVGAATVSGYRLALQEGATIIVKLDGDGQMDPRLIPQLVAPLRQGLADYAKGNRFYHHTLLRQMPGLRLAGNAILSFATKLSSGYWNVMDPTNGFTAIHGACVRALPLDKLDKRFFFESDVLFRLSTIRAAVADVPMRAMYEKGGSNLRVVREALVFPAKHLGCLLKRLVYNYFLRDFNLGSVQLAFGLVLCAFGAVFGAWHWYDSVASGVTASSGTVMLASLPFILGVQFLLGFVGYDVANTPRVPVHLLLQDSER